MNKSYLPVSLVVFLGLNSLLLSMTSLRVQETAETTTLIAPKKNEYLSLTLSQLQEKLTRHLALLKNLNQDNAAIWYAIANGYRHHFNCKEAVNFAQTIYEAITTSKELSDCIISDSYRCLSKTMRRKGCDKEALDYGLKAEYCGRNTDTYGQTLQFLGDMYIFGELNKEKGCAYYLKSFNWSQENNKTKCHAQALIGLGNARYTDKKHTTRSTWYLEALSVLEPNGSISLQAKAYIGLGNIKYTDLKHPTNTDWYLKALTILRPTNDTSTKAQALIKLGNARHIHKKYRTQSDWYRKALTLLGPNGDTFIKAEALIYLGDLCCSPRDTKKGLKYYQQALAIAPKNMEIAINDKIKNNLTRSQEDLLSNDRDRKIERGHIRNKERDRKKKGSISAKKR